MVALFKQVLKICLTIYYDFPKLVLVAFQNLKFRTFLLKKPVAECPRLRCVILGNGPSLLNDLESIENQKDKVDFFCVNHFADQEIFRIIKPKYMVVLDPYFWSIGADEYHKNKVNHTFSRLVESVSWRFRLFVPIYADRKVFDPLKENNLIDLSIYNSINQKLEIKKLEKFGFRHYILAPYAINVVFHAIHLAIQMGYKFIDLYGIDSSVFKQYEVDQLSNELYVIHKHFYGESRKTPNEAGLRQQPLSLDEALQKEVDIFKGYKLISEYAREMGVTLLNFSSDSFVDSIPRGQK